MKKKKPKQKQKRRKKITKNWEKMRKKNKRAPWKQKQQKKAQRESLALKDNLMRPKVLDQAQTNLLNRQSSKIQQNLLLKSRASKCSKND